MTLNIDCDVVCAGQRRKREPTHAFHVTFVTVEVKSLAVALHNPSNANRQRARGIRAKTVLLEYLVTHGKT